MTAEMFTSRDHRKFIPVLAQGTWDKAAPSWVRGKIYVDRSTEVNYKTNYPDLVSTMLGTRPAPPRRLVSDLGLSPRNPPRSRSPQGP